METNTYTTTLLISLLAFCAIYAPLYAQIDVHFEEQVLDDQVEIGYGLAIGDVDGDGKKDILLADKSEFVWYRNGDWKRHVMLSQLTERDNVCIAARDINGDGQVEVAVGAQWNPGETTDFEKSGSVHYLIRPEDPTQEWEAVPLPHLPTIHRMRWAKTGKDAYQLIVLPLHGIGNKRGEGEGVQVMAFEFPENPRENWSYEVLDNTMHITHNFDVEENDLQTKLYIGGKEGIRMIIHQSGKWIKGKDIIFEDYGFGEVRLGMAEKPNTILAGIEPMHGNVLSVYATEGRYPARTVLASDLSQGHALATGDLLKQGRDQIVVGWRNENEEDKVGIRMYVQMEKKNWDMHLIDDNGMACEDLKVADLNEDGWLDIIACGRASQNLKVYWNRMKGQ